MDLFNNKKVSKLNNKIDILNAKINKQSNKLEIIQKNKDEIEYILSLCKNEIKRLLLDNDMVNLSNTPYIKQNLCDNYNNYEFIFVLNYKHEEAIKSFNEYLNYYINKGVLADFLFDDINIFTNEFMIKNDSISKSQEIMKYKMNILKKNDRINVTDIKNGIKVEEKKINYIYKVKSKLSTKDLKRELYQFYFNDYSELAKHEYIANIYDLKYTGGKFLLFSSIKDLQAEILDKSMKKQSTILKAMQGRY